MHTLNLCDWWNTLTSSGLAQSNVLPGGANLLPVECNGRLQEVVGDTEPFTQQKRQLACIC